MISYLLCISCLLWRKVTGQALLPSKYPIGKGALGLAINIFALCFLIVVFIFSFCNTPNTPIRIESAKLTGYSSSLPSGRRPGRGHHELGMSDIRRRRYLSHRHCRT